MLLLQAQAAGAAGILTKLLATSSPAGVVSEACAAAFHPDSNNY